MADSSSKHEQELRFYRNKASFTKAFTRSSASVRSGNPDAGTQADISVILPGLLLSGKEVEANRALLEETGVTHILQVGIELSQSHSAFAYKRFPLYDLEDQDLVSILPECFQFIEEGMRSGKVLVHCAAGISRSASVVIAYLMHSQSLSLPEARALVKAARPIVSPNLGFLLQLFLFEKIRWAGFDAWTPWGLERFMDVKRIAMPPQSTAGPQQLPQESSA